MELLPLLLRSETELLNETDVEGEFVEAVLFDEVEAGLDLPLLFLCC